MKQNAVSRKLNAMAKEGIATILLVDISDPRLENVTITSCEVSLDCSVCNVFYTVLQGGEEAAREAFDKASGYIRHLMAQKMDWRVVPQLRFICDTSVDQAQRIGNALKSESQREHLQDFDESKYKQFDEDVQ